ncbi:MAG: ankyrin repeat domain-containing protein [Alphaproteobacteria bacterium]|nr:ankyrin repeat domain-containing protein [Alphaproteobacteria bacterium]
MSLLFEAIKNNDLRSLEKALKGACSSDDLAVALRNTSEQGQIKLVRRLLKAGARDEWAIVAAASFAPLGTVRLLYRRIGGNLNAALIGAAAHGRLETVRFLLTLPTETLNEALADAVLRGYSETAALLLKKGADPLAPVYNYQTAMEIAVKKERREIIDLMKKTISEKTNPNMPDKKRTDAF